MYENKEPLTREFVLSRISEEDIFLKYLNIYPNTTDFFINPLRTDTRPDCKFYRDARGVLKFNDFAYKFNIDCFNLVKITNKDVNNFNDVLKKVAKDFDLYNTEIDFTVKQNWEKALESAKKSLSSIRVKRRDFNKNDVLWWKEQGISLETLNLYKVSALDKVWLNDAIIYNYRKTDPGYVQYFKEYLYKCYFPLRDRYRFIQNIDASIIQGYNQLPEKGDILIITKSNKDVMALKEFGYSAVACASESILISEESYADLENRFFNVFSLFDRDRAGMRMSQLMKKAYGTVPLLFDTDEGLFFRRKNEAKDFTDHYKMYGLHYMIDLIEETKTIVL